MDPESRGQWPGDLSQVFGGGSAGQDPVEVDVRFGLFINGRIDLLLDVVRVAVGDLLDGRDALFG